MKCENHSDRIADHHCLSCNAPLCDPCAIYMENGTIMCDRCSLLAILEEKHLKAHEKLTTKKEQQFRFTNRKRREILIRKTVLYTVVLITAFVSLHVFHQLNRPKNREINLSEHSDALFFILDQAIYDYTQDNTGELPDSLEDLVGRYLPAERVGRNALAQFSYEKGIPPSYRLNFKENINNPIAGMVFTEEGLEWVE